MKIRNRGNLSKILTWTYEVLPAFTSRKSGTAWILVALLLSSEVAEGSELQLSRISSHMVQKTQPKKIARVRTSRRSPKRLRKPKSRRKGNSNNEVGGGVTQPVRPSTPSSPPVQPSGPAPFSVPWIQLLLSERFSEAHSVTFHGLSYPPLPTTNIDAYTTSHGISGIYSPSVKRSKARNEIALAAGVSIHCQNGTVARDSIILAHSNTGGEDFDEVRYLIEPSSIVCQQPISQWPENTVVQVNDPSMILRTINGQEYTYVLYTASHWRTLKKDVRSSQICGSIGLAIFDQELKQIYRNDEYLNPDGRFCYEDIRWKNEKWVDYGPEGFSRPEFKKNSEGSYEVVFDNAGTILSVPLLDFTALNINLMRQWGLYGFNDIFPIRIGEFNLALGGSFNFGGSGLLYTISSNTIANWTPFSRNLSSASTVCPAGWDCHGHASPGFFVDPLNCEGRMYVAGGKLSDDFSVRLYDHISLGYLKQPSNALGNALCSWLVDG